MQLQVLRKVEPLYFKEYIYAFLRGGRGSGKSFGVADYIIFRLLDDPDLNTLCLRETQRSIKFSSKKLISDRITHHDLNHKFEILDQEIRCKEGTGTMIFAGAKSYTIDNITSLEDFSLVWFEEARNASQYSLDMIIPTIIRNKNPKIFFTWNPLLKDTPIETLRREKSRSVSIFMNYYDNHFISENLVNEALEIKEKNLSKYQHIYLGHYGKREGVIFENVTIVDKMPEGLENKGCGIDWGFVDPTVIVSCGFIGNDLYLDELLHRTGMTTREIIKYIPTETQCYADSAEPDRILECKRAGLWVQPANKEVIAGINRVESFNIHITKRSHKLLEDFNTYAWKVDKNNITLEIPDHFRSDGCDSTRYYVHTATQAKQQTKTFTLKNL